jgi:hypothetical protein
MDSEVVSVLQLSAEGRPAPPDRGFMGFLPRSSRWLPVGTLLFSLVGGCAHVPRSELPAEMVEAIEQDFSEALRKELEARKPGARIDSVQVLKTVSRPDGGLKLRYRFAYSISEAGSARGSGATDEADGESVTVEQESEATLSPRGEGWEVTTVLPQGQTLAFARGMRVESPARAQ